MRYDVELNEDWDLVFSDGDISILSSENQESKLVLFANKGDFRQHPLIGAGFRSSRNAPFTKKMEREALIQLQNLGVQKIISLENL